ncbi:hypothetical protein ACTFIV_004738 [Dictyostelium citrinum]
MSTADATGGLTEEEENILWERSVQTWKQQKEERKKSNQELIDKGEKPIDYDNDWKDLPIFMQELPEEPSSNQYLAAFQSLSNDCTPEERAETFKNLGNDYFKEGKSRFNDALYYYNKALSVKCSDMKKNSIYLSNRAAVNMELGNYGLVIKDCTIATEFNPLNMKAYSRLARAQSQLSKYQDSIKTCELGLSHEPTNKDLQTIKENVNKKLQDIKRREQEKIDKENQLKQQQLLLATKLYEKNQYKLGYPIFDMSQYTYQSDRKITIDQNNDVHFPVVFLYPEFGKSDFIMDFQEDHTFGDHLQMMFPPENPEFAPWDTKKEYSMDRIEVYFETNWTKPILADIKIKEIEKKWIRVKHTTDIAKVISHPTYIIPEIPIFYIVSRGNLFYKKFLENKL